MPSLSKKNKSYLSKRRSSKRRSSKGRSLRKSSRKSLRKSSRRRSSKQTGGGGLKPKGTMGRAAARPNRPASRPASRPAPAPAEAAIKAAAVRNMVKENLLEVSRQLNTESPEFTPEFVKREVASAYLDFQKDPNKKLALLQELGISKNIVEQIEAKKRERPRQNYEKILYNHLTYNNKGQAYFN
jgi:hypothetical protein